jgi:hypothetical protein
MSEGVTPTYVHLLHDPPPPCAGFGHSIPFHSSPLHFIYSMDRHVLAIVQADLCRIDVAVLTAEVISLYLSQSLRCHA